MRSRSRPKQKLIQGKFFKFAVFQYLSLLFFLYFYLQVISLFIAYKQSIDNYFFFFLLKHAFNVFQVIVLNLAMLNTLTTGLNREGVLNKWGSQHFCVNKTKWGQNERGTLCPDHEIWGLSLIHI